MFAIGWGCTAMALVTTVAAQFQMGAAWRVGIDQTPTPLVTGGLFSLIRNPIFSAMLVAAFGVALATPSPWSIATALDFLLLLHLQARLEEHHLATLHGDRYIAYAGKVGRFLPGVGKLSKDQQA